jgi:uncharacterized protein (DUF983 family)
MQADLQPEVPSPDRRGAAAIMQAMRRGWHGRCPSCQQGRMFRAFLKVADHCPACGEELHHQRADDFPAYVVIVMVGHIVMPLVPEVEMIFAPPYWLSMALWPAAVIGLGLVLLQPVKGAIVGLQWVLGMHGFEAGKLAREALAAAPAEAAGDQLQASGFPLRR